MNYPKYQVRIDPFIVELIRQYAVTHRVSQAEVITFAVCELGQAFERNGYPEGWRIPRTPAVPGAAR